MAELATLAALLELRARERPDALAFAQGDDVLRYAALLDDAERAGAWLLHSGIRPGDRVALVFPAGLDFVRAFYALQRIGAVPCAFDPAVPASTTLQRIARIQPRCLLAGDDRPLDGAVVKVLRWRDRQDVHGNVREPLPPIPDDEHALAFLQPTSGTSGEPRAAMVLQRNAVASLSAARELLDPIASDVLVGWVPPWHDLGLMRFVLGPVFFGLPCHIVAPAVRTIPLWLSTIARVRGTISGAPDFAFRLAARMVAPGAVDLSSLRYATNGGEPVRQSTIVAFESRFGVPGAVRPGYGLAEATLGVTTLRPGEEMRVDDRGNVSCGRALSGVEVRIDDGEILVRGPAVFAGYFDAPEETHRALRDGWLHTGDAGHLDEDGHLYVLARRRAMLKRGGVPLAPRELEEAAQSVPGVRIAAAIGLPATARSSTEEIVLVFEAEGAADDASLSRQIAAAIERTLGFAPERILAVAPRSIPRTWNGKIRHRELREQFVETISNEQ
jgi:fatty-acyl-CoA synthase